MTLRRCRGPLLRVVASLLVTASLVFNPALAQESTRKPVAAKQQAKKKPAKKPKAQGTPAKAPAPGAKSIPSNTATPPSVIAVPAPESTPPITAKISPKQILTPDQAARRYEDGLAHERAGEERAAWEAYLQAGQGGHGPAQRKLGEIYDRGSSAVPRDYQSSLQWYQKARAQGVTVPRPHAYTSGR